LLDNAANYRKDTLQRRIVSAGLAHGLLMAEEDQWRFQRRTLAPLFARRAVLRFAPTMLQAANTMAARWAAAADARPAIDGAGERATRHPHAAAGSAGQRDRPALERSRGEVEHHHVHRGRS